MKNLGDLKPVQQLMTSAGDTENYYYRNLTLMLHELGDNQSSEKWWEVLEDCSDDFYTNTLSKLPYAQCQNSSVIYTFSDKLFPATLNWLTAGG